MTMYLNVLKNDIIPVTLEAAGLRAEMGHDVGFKLQVLHFLCKKKRTRILKKNLPTPFLHGINRYYDNGHCR